MPDDDLEFVYLTLEDALELYAAIVEGTAEQAAAAVRLFRPGAPHHSLIREYPERRTIRR